MTLTIAETVAKLDELLCPASTVVSSSKPDEVHPYRVWSPTALAVRAAVKDVALAARQAIWEFPKNEDFEAEIERQFGLPEGSEGGKNE